MVRTQIQLTEAQARSLRRMAREQGVSMAELIRRSVDAMTVGQESGRDVRYERAARLVGRFDDRSGARDLSKLHDEYLADAFE